MSRVVKLKKQTGLSLIEILVTVLIVNFGILGLSKLQLTNLKSINNSILSLNASFYAESLVDKLQGNSDYAKSSNSAYVLADFTDTPSSQASSAVCISSSCSAANLAIYDMNTWLYKIKTRFPKGKAKITKADTGSTTMYTIEIQWVYKSETNQYSLVTEL